MAGSLLIEMSVFGLVAGKEVRSPVPACDNKCHFLGVNPGRDRDIVQCLQL